MNEKPGIARTWIEFVRRWRVTIVASMMLWALIWLGVRTCAAQAVAAPIGGWVQHLSTPFVMDTLVALVGRNIVFTSGPQNKAVAQYISPDTVRLGVVPDTMSHDYILAHEVGHMWAEAWRMDTAVVNILLTHDAQERIGGYAAVRVGEHAAEAFAYAVLILRMPTAEQLPMLARVEQYVLGTTLVYERVKVMLVQRVATK